MNEKRYMIDDKPASAYDVICAAKELDDDYGADGICLTSVAADVLRRHGHTVGNNPEYTPNDRLHRPPGAAAEGGTVRGVVGTLNQEDGHEG